MAGQEMEIRMTDRQIMKLKELLKRVPIVGGEVIEFVAIMNELKLAMPTTRERINLED